MEATEVAVRPEESAVKVSALALEMLDQAKALEVKTDEQYVQASTMKVAIAKQLKEWDAQVKFFTDPHEAARKAAVIARDKIRDVFAAAFRPATEADQLLSQKRRDFERERAEAKRKEDERQRKLAEKRQDRAEARAEARGEEPPEPFIPVPTVAPQAKTIATEFGKVTTRTTWKWRYASTPEAAVSACLAANKPEWLQVNESAIGAAVRGGLRSIPGIEIYSVDTDVVR